MGTEREEQRHDERERVERFRLTPSAQALALAQFVTDQIRRERERRENGNAH